MYGVAMKRWGKSSLGSVAGVPPMLMSIHLRTTNEYSQSLASEGEVLDARSPSCDE